MNTPASPALNLLVLRAVDMEATRAFYEALGLSFRREKHGNGSEHFSCDAGGVLLEIYPRTSDATAEQTMLGLSVTSLEELLARLKPLGVEPKSGPRESERGRWASVLDPDGRTVRLSEER